MKGITSAGVAATVLFVAACGGLETERQSKSARGTSLLGDPLALTEVTIDDDDGHPTIADVDDETLEAIQQSLQAMLDTPAGLSCTLRTGPMLGEKHDEAFAVGAGRYLSFTASANGSGCFLDFGFKAHNEEDRLNPLNTTSARGTVAWRTSRANHPDPTCSDGQVKIDVTCMAAVATTQNTMPAAAEIKGFVTQATGQYADLAPGSPLCLAYGINGYCVVLTDATDGKKTGNPDTINQVLDFSHAPYTCVAPASPQNPLISGNITIKVH